MQIFINEKMGLPSSPKEEEEVSRELFQRLDRVVWEEHVAALCRVVLFGKASVGVSIVFGGTMAGLFQQALERGMAPGRWHIEHSLGRWFMRREDVYTVAQSVRYFTECRVVVDEWVPK